MKPDYTIGAPETNCTAGIIVGAQAERDQLREVNKELLALLKELIDIEGPQPGTVMWHEKVKKAIAEAEGREKT